MSDTRFENTQRFLKPTTAELELGRESRDPRPGHELVRISSALVVAIMIVAMAPTPVVVTKIKRTKIRAGNEVNKRRRHRHHTGGGGKNVECGPESCRRSIEFSRGRFVPTPRIHAVKQFFDGSNCFGGGEGTVSSTVHEVAAE